MKQSIIILTLTLPAMAQLSPQPVPPPATQAERNLCAAVLIAEAGGEGRAGMSAVWEVVHQRVKDRRWPNTHAKVVKQRWQFSCLNGITDGRLVARAQRHPMWRHAWGITGAPPVTQQVHQSNHYHNNRIRKPYWAKGEEPVAIIGNHLFYRLP